MDEFAINLIRILSDDSQVGEGTNVRAKYDLKTKMEAFKMATDWLTKRKKLNPDADDSVPGIDAMKAIIDERMNELNVIRIPPKGKPGGQTKEQARLKENYRAVTERVQTPPADDAQLRRMLGRTP